MPFGQNHASHDHLPIQLDGLDQIATFFLIIWRLRGQFLDFRDLKQNIVYFIGTKTGVCPKKSNKNYLHK